jgi:hypothetical protein
MTESETRAREHLTAGGGMFPADWVKDLINMIDTLRKENEELKSLPSFSELSYERDALVECSGYGKFRLRQTGRDRWAIDLNSEHIELYNKRGKRVRSNLIDNPDGDW